MLKKKVSMVCLVFIGVLLLSGTGCSNSSGGSTEEYYLFGQITINNVTGVIGKSFAINVIAGTYPASETEAAIATGVFSASGTYELYATKSFSGSNHCVQLIYEMSPGTYTIKYLNNVTFDTNGSATIDWTNAGFITITI